MCDKYNANKFFDDFMKYYNKAPNFARNLIHAGRLPVTFQKFFIKFLYNNIIYMAELFYKKKVRLFVFITNAFFLSFN